MIDDFGALVQETRSGSGHHVYRHTESLPKTEHLQEGWVHSWAGGSFISQKYKNLDSDSE